MFVAKAAGFRVVNKTRWRRIFQESVPPMNRVERMNLLNQRENFINSGIVVFGSSFHRAFLGSGTNVTGKVRNSASGRGGRSFNQAPGRDA